MSSVLDRTAFLAAMPRRHGEFVCEGRGTIRYQSLTALEKSQYEAARYNPDGTPNRARILDAPARLIAACVVDANGTRYLNKDDVAAIQEMDGGFVEQLFLAIHKHVYEGQLSLEGAIKNSEETPGELSQSA